MRGRLCQFVKWGGVVTKWYFLSIWEKEHMQKYLESKTSIYSYFLDILAASTRLAINRNKWEYTDGYNRLSGGRGLTSVPRASAPTNEKYTLNY
jgi:hypothetical protein